MSKRLKGLLLVVVLLTLLTSAVFATESNKDIKPVDAIEVVSPRINNAGEVISDQHLLISLKINAPVTATLTLVRLDEPSLVLSPDKAALVSDAAAKLAASTGLDKSVATNDLSKETVAKALLDAQSALSAATKKYDALYASVGKVIGVSELESVVLQGKLLQSGLTELYDARVSYEMALKQYKRLKAMNDAMYRVTVVNQEPIVLTGALPYFNLKVNDIVIGKYEMTIRSVESGVISRRTFVIKKQEQAVKEIIKSVKDHLNVIWSIE